MPVGHDARICQFFGECCYVVKSQFSDFGFLGFGGGVLAGASAENDDVQKRIAHQTVPPTYPIYVAGLVFDWLENTVGGLDKMYERNKKKADLLYDYLDSQDYYTSNVKRENRSMMNVRFVTGDPDLDAKFVKESKLDGMTNLKGHRSTGGMRASIYNAMPYEGVEHLVAFMKKFAAENPKPKASACSAVSILAFSLKTALNLELFTFASPAITTNTGLSPTKNDRVLAIRSGGQCSAWAANSTVAEDSSKISTRSAIPLLSKNPKTLSKDIAILFST